MWNRCINGSTCVRAEDVHDSVQPPGKLQEFIMRVRHRVRKIPFLLLIMVVMSFFHASHCVWSFNIPHQAYLLGGVSPWRICEQDGMSKTQTHYCKKQDFLDLMSSFGQGAKMAIEECKFQFQFNRWNCSIPKRHEENLFWRLQDQDTREAAYTYAIASAGVVWALARACSESNLSRYCDCSRERRPDGLNKKYTWGGCGDNIRYAANVTEVFMDAEEKDNMRKGQPSSDTSTLKRVLMNVHNNQVGRLVVKEMSIIECKCHGVSGSCNFKTCWRQLSEFREIGNRLHDKYDAAVRVVSRRHQGLLTLQPQKVARSYSKRQTGASTLDPSQLIYLNPSPDFCIRNEQKGIHGTKGRKCIKDSPGADSCSLLCCDRGYTSKVETVQKRCRCKFHWCCYVKCKTCTSKVLMHTCK